MCKIRFITKRKHRDSKMEPQITKKTEEERRRSRRRREIK